MCVCVCFCVIVIDNDIDSLRKYCYLLPIYNENDSDGLKNPVAEMMISITITRKRGRVEPDSC